MANNKALTNEPLIKIKGVKKHFPLKKTKLFQKHILTVKANDGIDLVIHKGETLGLVGESGCGKSTLGRLILQLYPQTSGKIIYYGYSLEEFAPRYLYKGVMNLKKYQLKYNNLSAKIPLIENQIEKLKKDPAHIQKRRDLTDKVEQIKRENERLFDACKSQLGAFIISNDINAIKNYPKLDSIIYKNEQRINKCQEKINVLNENLEKAKLFKNEQAETEIADIKKQLEKAEVNVVADLHKKLAIAERKAKEHITVIDVEIRNLNNQITLIKSRSEEYIRKLKASLDKNIELNTEILTKLVEYKVKHYGNQQLIKKYENEINFKNYFNQIDRLKAKIDNILDKSSYVTGAFILSPNLDEVVNVLGYYTSVKHNLKVSKEKLNMLKVDKIKLENSLTEKKEDITQLEKDHINNKIRNTNLLIDNYTRNVKHLEKSAEAVSQQIEDLKVKIMNHELFEKLENNREKGLDLSLLTNEEMRVLRKELQLIFQDPYSSLNPRLTVGQIINEGIKAHNLDKLTSASNQEQILSVMDKCGLAPYMLHRYPHQFSGGQRQRIGIARALGVNPNFIVCDEAVSALDVSIQSQIINLLEDLREQENLTYLFISHDLSVIKHISDRIGVMYLGKIVELGDSEEIYANPLHPYTKALISSIPTTEQGEKKRILLEGDIPSNVFPPSGCKFRTRCPLARKECAKKVPEFREVEPGRFVACHFYEETKNLRAN